MQSEPNPVQHLHQRAGRSSGPLRQHLHDSEVKCLLYADDMVLMSPTAEGLQNSLALLEQYCEEWAQPGQNQSHGVPEEGQVSGKQIPDKHLLLLPGHPDLCIGGLQSGCEGLV